MSVTAALSTPVLSVSPGQTVVCAVHVRNSGKEVDHFALDVRGDASSFAMVSPAVLTVPPADEAIARLVFRPPSSGVLGGETPFSVRIASLDRPEAVAPEEELVEGVVIVGAVSDVMAVLVPDMIACKIAGRSLLAVHNRGNCAVGVDALATDPRQHLSLKVSPPAAIVEPGAVRYFAVRARPKRPSWSAAPRTLPYHMLVLPEGQEPLAADGHVVQERMNLWWAVLVAFVLLAGVVIGAAL